MPWLTLSGSNYPCLERISMVPKMFEQLRFDLCIWRIRYSIIWASAWQNLQNGMCAQRRLRSTLASAQQSVFAVRMKKAWVFSYPLSAQRRLWSDWTDAQADLSLRWAHMPFCRFCHALAHFTYVDLLLANIRGLCKLMHTPLPWALIAVVARQVILHNFPKTTWYHPLYDLPSESI